MKAVAVSVVALFACGSSPRPMHGPIGVAVDFVGDWPDQPYVLAFINDIGSTGYFDPLDVSFYVDPNGPVKMMLVSESSSSATLAEPSGCAWHDPDLSITVAPRCANSGQVFESITHELVELASDPNIAEDDGSEIADVCESKGPLVVKVNGRKVTVARYMANGVCGPWI